MGSRQDNGKLDKALSGIIIIIIIATALALGYTVAFPRVNERFTEFYILGAGGRAADYPRDFVLADGQVVSVGYDNGQSQIGGTGNLIVGIINREQTDMTYEVALLIDGQQAPIVVDGAVVDNLGPIYLGGGEKFEKDIGFTPVQPGEKQKVEFVLMVGGKPYFDTPPHLLINAST